MTPTLFGLFLSNRILFLTLIVIASPIGKIIAMPQCETVVPFGKSDQAWLDAFESAFKSYEAEFSNNLLEPSDGTIASRRHFYSKLDLESLRVMKSFPGKAASLDAAWELTLVNALTSNRDLGSITSEFLGFVQAKLGFSVDEALINKFVCASSRTAKTGLYFSSRERPPLDFALKNASGNELYGKLPSQNKDGFVICKASDNEVWRLRLKCPSEWNRPFGQEDYSPFCVGHSLSSDHRRILLMACFDSGIVLFEIDCTNGTCVFGRAYRNELGIRVEIKPSHSDHRPGLIDQSGGLEDGDKR